MKTVIEQIKDRLPITEVLASYLTLTQSGTQYKARCPFHNERTASFYVSPERASYYCFGCGAKGDIFNFVEQFEGLDFKGALKVLADKAHITLDGANLKSERNDDLYAIHDKATALYIGELSVNKDMNVYLHDRGLTDETISAFSIGYAPSEWRYLSTKLHDRDITLAEQAGLIKSSEKGFYDRFRGRIMFPLRDSSGRVVGFSGRSVPDIESSPKYLNSPETPLFHKSEILYGFDVAKFSIKKNNFAILVEGQFDLLLSHQAGFKNTVATSGTAVSEEVITNTRAHMHAISRLTPNIILAFDGDEAGQNAAARAALVALALGMNTKVAALPKGKDPADFIKENGADAWKEVLKKSVSFIEHQTERIIGEGVSPQKLVAGLKASVFPYLARVRSHIERGQFIERIASIAGISSSDVRNDLEDYQKALPAEKIENTITNKEVLLTPYERYIGLRHGAEEGSFAAFDTKLSGLVFHDTVFSSPPIDESRLEHVSLLVEREYGESDIHARLHIAEELVSQICREFYQGLKKKYTLELTRAEKAWDDQKSQQLLTLLSELHNKIKE